MRSFLWFDANAAQPSLWHGLTRIGCGMGPGSGQGLGLGSRVGLGLCPYLDPLRNPKTWTTYQAEDPTFRIAMGPPFSLRSPEFLDFVSTQFSFLHLCFYFFATYMNANDMLQSCWSPQIVTRCLQISIQTWNKPQKAYHDTLAGR